MLDLDNAVYALDASTIDLRLSVFPWALFRSTKRATSQPLSTSPTASYTTSMSLFLLIPEPGAFYIIDRGHMDFERLFTLHRTRRFFVISSPESIKSLNLTTIRFISPGMEVMVNF